MKAIALVAVTLLNSVALCGGTGYWRGQWFAIDFTYTPAVQVHWQVGQGDGRLEMNKPSLWQ
jgi:hypothetical protein